MNTSSEQTSKLCVSGRELFWGSEKRTFHKVGAISELCNGQTLPSPFWCPWLQQQKLRPRLSRILRCTGFFCWSWGIHQQDGSERTTPSWTDNSASSHSKKHEWKLPWCEYPVPVKLVTIEACVTKLNVFEDETRKCGNHIQESISLRKWNSTATILEKDLAFRSCFGNEDPMAGLTNSGFANLTGSQKMIKPFLELLGKLDWKSRKTKLISSRWPIKWYGC